MLILQRFVPVKICNIFSEISTRGSDFISARPEFDISESGILVLLH